MWISSDSLWRAMPISSRRRTAWWTRRADTSTSIFSSTSVKGNIQLKTVPQSDARPYLFSYIRHNKREIAVLDFESYQKVLNLTVKVKRLSFFSISYNLKFQTVNIVKSMKEIGHSIGKDRFNKADIANPENLVNTSEEPNKIFKIYW